MKIFSQVDPLWKNDKLGSCSDTIGKSGCKVVCYSMIADKTPQEINKILKEKNGYTNGCLTEDKKCCEILGLEYNGKVYTKKEALAILDA
jgi:hypothetical protein